MGKPQGQEFEGIGEGDRSVSASILRQKKDICDNKFWANEPRRDKLFPSTEGLN